MNNLGEIGAVIVLLCLVGAYVAVARIAVATKKNGCQHCWQKNVGFFHLAWHDPAFGFVTAMIGIPVVSVEGVVLLYAPTIGIMSLCLAVMVLVIHDITKRRAQQSRPCQSSR